MRGVIYARYSTDKQRETSIEDQVRVCQARADQEGIVVMAVCSDEGVSGSTPVNARAGGARMLADALAERFEALILEGLDRLSRDLVEAERIVRRLEHKGIRIIGVSDGYDSRSATRKLHRGMRSLINEAYIDDLRSKVHRGLGGQFARGLATGGMPYGYTTTAAHDGRKMVIDENEAPHVRWIFERYAEGISPRQIAYELNQRRIPSTRGGTWAMSALYGHPQKNTGILRNEIYIGVYHWNRSQWIKDPDTGVRKRIERPRSEWKTQTLPDLRIVPDDIWQKAQQRLGTVPPVRGAAPRSKGKPQTSMLSGLLICGVCGAPMVAAGQYSYGCSARIARGPSVCAGLTVPRKRADQSIVALLRDDLLSDASIDAMRKEVARLAQHHAQHAHTRTAAARKRLADVDGEISRLVEAIAITGISPALRERLQKAEAERAQLQQDLAAPAESISTTMIPRLVERYRDLVDRLPDIMRLKPAQARDALRGILGEITITREGREIWAEMRGAFGQIASINVVAGERFRIYRRIPIR